MGFILIEFSKEQLNLIRTISTTEGFVKMFEDNLPVSKTFSNAYEMTERTHEDIFGERKYSSYKSFSTCRKKIK
jgi:hypothetical protein